MKKVIAIILAITMLFALTACGREAAMPNSFVEDGEERFILVDNWREDLDGSGKQGIYVIADKVTGVMYLVIASGYHMGLTALLCEDGSPMLYDPF